ncbi:hypothetical protein Nepgr_017632 [Nepenthes gracilis]|uniref:Calponin-homology (CH) domain-containing protein n=1 Tax=Nepenthes gracilis TaxID=150966 RepID=A0AAD3SSE5_NEPGR|nr:hypothetical protein Nepgr_017632 [Nepenthes gracilis]
MEEPEQEARHEQNPCPSPFPKDVPPPYSSTILKDLSNLKTPRHHPSLSSRALPPQTATTPQFFTASKQTPSSSFSTVRRPRRQSSVPSAVKSRAARRLKQFELEQSQSARKELIKKERSLKCLAKSITVWLNFLFENPRMCGCSDLAGDSLENKAVFGVGKRESLERNDGCVGIEGLWRLPKRQREGSWRNLEEAGGDGDLSAEIVSSKFSVLKNSLREVCSFEDLRERMRGYLSLTGCKEVFNVMTHVAKNIDEGRLKMKAHCPIVSDVGMRQKAIKTLMCYSPIWLRIGLYIIFGGESLLPDADSNTEQEIAFLKMVLEKQFFSHAALAKTYAYNKFIEGLYRPGYFETLGNVILKRVLLLVLILDRAKSQSCLPIKYGIDGLDGGSPLLFTVQSGIKSSRQMVIDFLSSDVMSGEGNLLAHLMIVGYKVNYQQLPLTEYDFRVVDLFHDIQDGVRLCRAIQLLQHDSSILGKLIIPSETRKKKTVNCGIALQYLKQAGVPLCDDDGTMACEEDIANGDKELTLSVLWNMFLHLQLSLLITKTVLSDEISKIRKAPVECIGLETSTHLDMILNWMKAICENYHYKMENFASLVDGKAMWCLLDFYFGKELGCFCDQKNLNDTSWEESVVSTTDTTDAVRNFVLSQRLSTLLGNIPEVLEISDILECNGACNARSVVILLVFLASHLLVKKSKDQLNFHKFMGIPCQTLDRRHSSTEKWLPNSEALQVKDEGDLHITEAAVKKFKAVQATWQEMAEQNHNWIVKPAAPTFLLSSTSHCSSEIRKEKAAIVIQSNFRRVIKHWTYLKIKNAVSTLQLYIRAWLIMKQTINHSEFTTNVMRDIPTETWRQSSHLFRYVIFMIDRHNFVKLKSSTLLIQKAARFFVPQRHQRRGILTEDECSHEEVSGAIQMRNDIEDASLDCKIKAENDLQIDAAVQIQLAWKRFSVLKSQRNRCLAATIVQSHFRTWVLRRNFVHQKQAILKIQNACRSLRFRRNFQEYRVGTRSAIIIQSHVRGWICRRGICQHRHCIIVIQSHCRTWLARKAFLSEKEAAIRIQCAVRAMICCRAFDAHKYAAIEIQCYVRGRITRTRLLGASCLGAAAPRYGISFISRGGFQRTELKIVLHVIVKLQRWWKRVLMQKSRIKAAIVIQSHTRGWIGRQKAARERHHIVLIQSYWKGYLARRDERDQLMELRLRVQKSAANVDDGMRIINRHIAALNELLGMKSLSNILRNCAILDRATGVSQKCCEVLVDAGAINILLKQIRSVSRSIPDQEVLKHAMSILRNLARYPHLADVLIDHRGSVETIIWELLRSKEEGYFIACELLKKICHIQKGIEAIRSLAPLLKRLHIVVEDLARKTSMEKRNNHRGAAARDTAERRLSEAVELLHLITHG